MAPSPKRVEGLGGAHAVNGRVTTTLLAYHVRSASKSLLTARNIRPCNTPTQSKTFPWQSCW